MCGIAGLLVADGAATASAQAQVAAMNRVLVHRGPDGGGVYIDGPVALGAQRLAILDPERGRQPFSSSDGTMTVVFNGEIYNHAEIRHRLQGAGFGFSTKTDTEVLLNAYASMGTDCVDALEGMFAFAIWDRRKQTLFLARDRLGIKPLYYTWQPPFFGFGSEAKALFLSPFEPPSLDPQSVADVLYAGYPMTPGATMFRHIRSLGAGHCMEVSVSGLRCRQYWDVSFDEASTETLEGSLERMAELLESSVRRQLVADVPLGSCLSGGIDSSVLTAIAARELSPLPTYSIGYATNREIFARRPRRIVGELVGDDLPVAGAVAEALRTAHRSLLLPTDGLLEELDRMIWHREKPLVTLAEYGHFALSRAAARDVKVLLSGQGADEICGGYYYWWQRRSAENTRTFPWLGLAMRSSPAGTIDSLLQVGFKKETKSALRVKQLFDDAMARARTPDFFNQLSYLFVKFHLHEMLELEDRNSMASSVEVRVPYLDERLLPWVLNLPSSVKVPDGKEKFLLRETARRYLPELPPIIWTRKKSPMPPPLAVEGLVSGMVAVLRSRKAAVRDYLEPAALERFLDEIDALPAELASNPRHFALFRLYFLERWHHVFSPQG